MHARRRRRGVPLPKALTTWMTSELPSPGTAPPGGAGHRTRQCRSWIRTTGRSARARPLLSGGANGPRQMPRDHADCHQSTARVAVVHERGRGHGPGHGRHCAAGVIRGPGAWGSTARRSARGPAAISGRPRRGWTYRCLDRVPTLLMGVCLRAGSRRWNGGWSTSRCPSAWGRGPSPLDPGTAVPGGFRKCRRRLHGAGGVRR